MKLARRNNGITEIAVIGCKQRIPFCLAFPFGADQMNVDWLSLIRQAPLSAVKVLALSRNSGGTAGALRLVLMLDGRFFVALRTRKVIL